MREGTNVLFREVQRFHQPWLWVLIVVSVLATIGLFGEPWGDRPMSDTALAILFGIGILALFASIRLITEVRQDGLYIRFVPFHLSFRRIAPEGLEGFEPLTYRPILNYGGWGIKWGRGGIAYNVSGNRGVRLNYTNGKHILIGSQRADELAQAIGTVLGRTD